MGRGLPADFTSATAPHLLAGLQGGENQTSTGQGGISKHEMLGALQQPPLIPHQLPPVLTASAITMGASFSSASSVGPPCP